jgi:hypothetical protein
MGEENQKRGKKGPDYKNDPRVSFRNLEYKKVQKKNTYYSSPGFNNDKKLSIIFPATPGTVELKILKADKGRYKRNCNKPVVVVTPGNMVDFHKAP